MCITFTGRELLCSGTLSRQQSSHATLKPKLRVQIKRMVMKDLKKKTKTKRKGPVGVSLELSQWAMGTECEAVWFSQWVRRRPRTTYAEAPGVEASPPAPHPGWNREGTRSQLLLHLPSREERTLGSQADGSGSQRVPGWLLIMPGKSH